jgi:hypothetical protein
MPKVQHSIWYSAPAPARNLWASCVWAVHSMWDSIGQVPHVSHRPVSTLRMVGIEGGFLHGLYHFCTQLFPTRYTDHLSLLLSHFSTLSTPLIKTTTNHKY